MFNKHSHPHTIIYIILLLFFSVNNFHLGAYTLISDMNTSDQNYSSLIENLKNPIQEKKDFPLIFEYQLKSHETLLSISKLINVSISTLITINRSNGIERLKTNNYILIPIKKGLYIPIHPKNDLEYLLFKRLHPTLTTQLPQIIKSENTIISGLFYFLEDRVLTELEYMQWLKTDFRTPVLEGNITSYFGKRISPISGNIINHNGLDIAADSGDEIFAAKSGTVIDDGYNSVFGYYIIIEHADNFKTLYGHLLDAIVKIGDTVYTGEHIAYMGNTGSSTGHHVHFEIHHNEKPINPLIMLEL